jgi:predicted DNA binding CopG/RHH family protein
MGGDALSWFNMPRKNSWGVREVTICAAQLCSDDPHSGYALYVHLMYARGVAKAKMKQVVIPKFRSEAEEAAWWDAHRSEIEAEIRQRMKQKKPLALSALLQGAKVSQPVTLRIAKEDLETARRLAARKGLGYQTYIKMLLRDALERERA